MPVVYRKGGLKIHLWPNDHPPPHVHVTHADGEAVIEIESLAIRRNEGLRPRTLAEALDIVDDLREFLTAKWRELHG